MSVIHPVYCQKTAWFSNMDGQDRQDLAGKLRLSNHQRRSLAKRVLILGWRQLEPSGNRCISLQNYRLDKYITM
jgi:hypothetical protein